MKTEMTKAIETMIEMATKAMADQSADAAMAGKAETVTDPVSKTAAIAAKKAVCHRCGGAITDDEIGISKKLINRGTTSYYCIPCLADTFEVKPSDIEAKILYFKKMGCTLFASPSSVVPIQH